MYCSLSICKCDVLLLRCLDCHEDQDTQHVTTISSLHRSKVGSISAAEAVKSLQQPVLLKADPLRSRGGLIFSRTLHSYPRLHSHQSWYLCDRVLLKANKDVATGQTQGWVRTRGRSPRDQDYSAPPPPCCLPPPSRTQVSINSQAIVNLGI